MVVYSLLWLVVPWSRAVALFIAGAAFLWILFFSSLIVNVKRREIIAALALSIPFAFAALSTEALIWYGLGPLATLIWLIYLARGPTAVGLREFSLCLAQYGYTCSYFLSWMWRPVGF